MPQRAVEPATDVVARGPTAMDDLVVAAAAAQVARPAARARRLRVDMALGEPALLCAGVDAGVDVTELRGWIVDEAVNVSALFDGALVTQFDGSGSRSGARVLGEPRERGTGTLSFTVLRSPSKSALTLTR